MSKKLSSTTNSRRMKASAQTIYKAFTEAEGLSAWMAPGEMVAKVHHLNAVAGGGYEMSLFYPESEKQQQGKTSGKEDRFSAKFLELKPFTKIVTAINFDTEDAQFSGEMIMEVNIEASDNDSIVTITFRDIPPGIDPKDNEDGTEQSLQKLEAYVRNR